MRKILIVAIMLFAVMIPVFAEGQIGVTLAPEWFWFTSVGGEKIPESFGESSFMLSVDGANYFGENGGFGVEYGVGLGLPMRIWEGQLSAKSPEKAGFAFNVGAGYRYEFSDLVGIVAGLGLGGYYQNSAAILGADGFISMAGFQQETLIRFQNSKLLLPCAYTPNEAMEMLRLGAHFIKLIGPDTSLLRILTSPPLFHTIPCFVTGGMTLERIPETIQAGAVLIGTGFDLMLNGYDGDDPDEIAAVVRRYMQAVRDVRLSVNPALATLDTCDDAAIWRQLLEYHSPFAEALP